jgi:hypothetical protein
MAISLPPNTFDNDEILMLVRSCSFKSDSTLIFNNFSPFVGRTYPSEIKILPMEVIKVPAGDFKCFKVKLTAIGQNQYVWYSISKPHYLVKYDNNEIVFMLKEVSPGAKQ